VKADVACAARLTSSLSGGRSGPANLNKVKKETLGVSRSKDGFARRIFIYCERRDDSTLEASKLLTQIATYAALEQMRKFFTRAIKT
jgi:hypothetical protein